MFTEQQHVSFPTVSPPLCGKIHVEKNVRFLSQWTSVTPKCCVTFCSVTERKEETPVKACVSMLETGGDKLQTLLEEGLQKLFSLRKSLSLKDVTQNSHSTVGEDF